MIQVWCGGGASSEWRVGNGVTQVWLRYDSGSCCGPRPRSPWPEDGGGSWDPPTTLEVVWQRCGGGASKGVSMSLVQGGFDGGARVVEFKAHGWGRACQRMGTVIGSPAKQKLVSWWCEVLMRGGLGESEVRWRPLNSL